MCDLWNGEHSSIACRGLKAVVGQHHKEFGGNEQQDAQEFFMSLMDWLHNDLKKEDESIIWKSFYFNEASTIKCCLCSTQSKTYVNYPFVTLPLPSAARCSLLDCLRLYTTKEEVVRNCRNCKSNRAVKYLNLSTLPPTLVIHLNRFYFDGVTNKMCTLVDFDLEGFSMVDQEYDLCTVVNHYGETVHSGHYSAYCRIGKKWYNFSDEHVTPLTDENVCTENAYMLFYTMRVQEPSAEPSRKRKDEAQNLVTPVRSTKSMKRRKLFDEPESQQTVVIEEDTLKSPHGIPGAESQMCILQVLSKKQLESQIQPVPVLII